MHSSQLLLITLDAGIAMQFKCNFKRLEKLTLVNAIFQVVSVTSRVLLAGQREREKQKAIWMLLCE